MRSLLLIGFTALALSFSGYDASAATLGEPARSAHGEWAALTQLTPSVDRREQIYIRDATPAMTLGARDKNETSLADAVATVAALAGVGVVLTLAAVGLRRVWTQDPIRDPLGEGPGFL
jgi:hypothetical protein